MKWGKVVSEMPKFLVCDKAKKHNVWEWWIARGRVSQVQLWDSFLL